MPIICYDTCVQYATIRKLLYNILLLVNRLLMDVPALLSLVAALTSATMRSAHPHRNSMFPLLCILCAFPFQESSKYSLILFLAAPMRAPFLPFAWTIIFLLRYFKQIIGTF